MSSKNVAAKLILAWGHIGSIPKNGRNQTFNYNFVREEDAADALRHAFMKVGLACVPSVVDCKMSTYKTGKGVDMNHAIITMDFTLTDKDTGETETFRMMGEASDTADKAVYKAITGCTKYAYVKLAMSGAEDNEEEDIGPRTETPTPKDTAPKPVPAGATFRKPEETARPTGQSNPPATQGQAKAEPAHTKSPTQQEKPADRPLSTQTAPPEQESTSNPEVVTLEDMGKITSVVPAMKGKPASISFKRTSDGGVYPIHFDAKQIDVPGLLKLLNSKAEVQVICDITSGNPFLMSIKGV